MLASLSIRNFVLVDRLDIEFRAGLCVLTGETGAGKSILLDALGLAIGARADSSYVRGGAGSGKKAVITATFELPDDHAALARLAEQSSILVTRPLSGHELSAQGWTSRQMSYDTRHLLHYFRLLPDNRMLFGLRADYRATPASFAATRKRAKRSRSRRPRSSPSASRR